MFALLCMSCQFEVSVSYLHVFPACVSHCAMLPRDGLTFSPHSVHQIHHDPNQDEALKEDE